MSSTMATPARIQRAAGLLVLSCARKTNVGPRCSVLYTGHRYTPFSSALSALTLRQLTTGNSQNISRGFDLSTMDAVVSQRAPCRNMPCTYAPSRLCASTSSSTRFVTSVWITSLSSSCELRCAVCWLMAVRNDCGLIRPPSHVTLGISDGFATHSPSCPVRLVRLCSHDDSGRSDGHASLAQLSGTRSRKREFMRPSIASDTVSSPAKPWLSSISERVTSVSSVFICSHSSINTFWNGPRSSMLFATSSKSNLVSPNRSRMSLR
mmetsp:Transcript_24626/g.85662  ORF Transcript_24626/g.85662 Transcript_24626/m.85662 type:complete len:265 (-) Transcript_24626:432-1226(-)